MKIFNLICNYKLPKKYLFPQFFQNDQKLWIYHRDWILPAEVGLKKPKGVVIISHGLGEHISRYEHIAQELNKEGFVVYGMDHQGHGLSDGDRCYCQDFDDLLNDLITFCERIKKEYNKECKLFLLGHSAGGLLASRLAYMKPDLFDGGVILSSPFFGPSPEQDVSPFIRSIGQFLSTFFPKLPVVRINNLGLSHESNILYRLERDPLHFHGKLPVRTAYSIGEKSRRDIINCKTR